MESAVTAADLEVADEWIGDRVGPVAVAPAAPAVERVVGTALPVDDVDWTAIGYREVGEEGEHMALILGEVAGAAPVHIHYRCLLGDVFGSRLCSCSTRLETALVAIEQAGRGVVVYVRGAGVEISAVGPRHPVDRRDREIGSQILADLGVDPALPIAGSS